MTDEATSWGDLREAVFGDNELEVRNASERIIGVKIAAWGEVADTPIGLETFLPGSFARVDPRKVILQLEHQGAAGRGLSLEERSDGAHMTFKVSKTPLGDELLTLASDGVTPHTSVSYRPGRSKGETRQVNGRRVTAWSEVDLAALSTTWKPYYGGTAVEFVRSQEQRKDGQMPETAPNGAETPQAGAQAPVVDWGTMQSALDRMATTMGTSVGTEMRSLGERLDGRIAELEERARQQIVIPALGSQGDGARAKPKIYEWFNVAVRMLTGELVQPRELAQRALDDVLTTDAPGVVPDAFLPDIIGVIEPFRPFLESTRRIPVPPSGMSIVVPVLGTRATVDKQDTEKSFIDSTKPTVTTQSFDGVSIFGGADVSIQLLRRSSPEFGALLMDELAEAYAADSDAEAIAALLAATVSNGSGSIDPEGLTIGEAWTNSLTNMKRPPTHIWMSSAAVQAFMDAKNDGSNSPLYGTLGADFSVAGGVGGKIQGLTPVYVPALDGTGSDVIVGPSSGFAWAEDGTFTLQVDVPSKAGRDIALGGILFPMPRYPLAFTEWALSGG